MSVAHDQKKRACPHPVAAFLSFSLLASVAASHGLNRSGEALSQARRHPGFAPHSSQGDCPVESTIGKLIENLIRESLDHSS